MEESKINPDEPFFGVLGVFVLVLLLSFAIIGFVYLHSIVLGPRNQARYWFFDSDAGVATALLFSILLRPRLLTFSKWTLSALQVLLGTMAGLLVYLFSEQLFYSSYPGFDDVPLGWQGFLSIVIVGPILEELLTRGVLLRSMLNRAPVVPATIVVSLLAAADHPDFWRALPLQVALCALYVVTRNSLPACITCHIVTNAVAAIFTLHHA